MSQRSTSAGNAASAAVGGRRSSVAAAVALTSVAIVVAAALTATKPGSTATAQGGISARALMDATLAGNPYYAGTLWGCSIDEDPDCGLPAVVAFTDTPAEPDASSALARHRTLAASSAVGTVNGLAWDPARRQLYAAAYQHALHPAAGDAPGALYRIDVGTGEARRWAVLAAGASRHDAAGRALGQNASGVGRVGLGDIEIADEGGRPVLVAVNLFDRRIWRLTVPDAVPLGAFAHGAAGEPWAANARPFGLAVHDGWLYHAVVDSREDPGLPGALGVHVYRSRPDGSAMREVLALPLDYPRVPPWTPWTDAVDTAAVRERRASQPMAVGLAFRPGGDMVLGLRDRIDDLAGNWSYLPNLDGDLIPAARAGPDRWVARTDPEHYVDAFRFDESATGAVAAVPGRDGVVAGVRLWSHVRAAMWFDNRRGSIAGPADGEEWLNLETYDGGDIEALALYPTATPAPAPTASPAPPPRLHLPLTLNERCPPRRRRVDVALVVDASTSMERPTAAGRPKLAAVQEAARLFLDQLHLAPDADRRHDQVAIAGFNASAWTAVALTNDGAALRVAVDGLAGRMAPGTRLDLAIEQGQAALSDAGRRRAENAPVMILLTDGLPNGVPTPSPAGAQEDTVLARAARAKAVGMQIYAIGVGRPDAADPADRIHAGLLRAVASSPAHYVDTPDAEALASIYQALAVTITDGCPAGRHNWGRRWP